MPSRPAGAPEPTRLLPRTNTGSFASLEQEGNPTIEEMLGPQDVATGAAFDLDALELEIAAAQDWMREARERLARQGL